MTTPPSEPPPEKKERRGARFVRDRVEDAVVDEVVSELESQPNEQQQPSWRSHFTRARVVIGAIVGAILTTFAILGGVFDLFPGLKPDEPCPREHEATVTDVTLDQSVTRGEALILQQASTQGVPAARLAQPGKLVSFDIRARGFDRDPLQVFTWVLREAGGPAADPELRNQLAHTFTPAGCNDALHLQVWSPTPRLGGAYRIELRLLAPDRTIVETARTDLFTVEGSGAA